jgi:hypothetical protein
MESHQHKGMSLIEPIFYIQFLIFFQVVRICVYLMTLLALKPIFVWIMIHTKYTCNRIHIPKTPKTPNQPNMPYGHSSPATLPNFLLKSHHASSSYLAREGFGNPGIGSGPFLCSTNSQTTELLPCCGPHKYCRSHSNRLKPRLTFKCSASTF